MAKASVFEMVTERVLEQMAKGIVPWQKPWASVFGGCNGDGLAISYTSRKPYALINQFILPCGEYITLNEINKLGGHLKKGSKSHEVYGFFRSFMNKEDKTFTTSIDANEDADDYRLVWNMRYFKVFNVEDCEGIEPKGVKDATPLFTHSEDIVDAESVITAYVEREGKGGFTFHNNKSSNSAFYAPREDKVVVPCKAQYKNIVEYYSTTFHELTHSSGAEKRMNRKGITDFDAFGSHQYSQEELVAELGSAMMLGVLGIEDTRTFNNSVAYLQSWSRKLKDQPKMIVYAAAQAESAVKYILNGTKKK